VEPELVDVDAAARLLGIGRTALYALLRQGEIPVIKIGRSTRVSVVSLRDFIERKEAEAMGLDSISPV